MKTIRIFLGALGMVLIVGAGLYLVFPEAFQRVSTVLPLVKNDSEQVTTATTTKNEFYSSPLRSNENNTTAQLDAEGVIALTNQERRNGGVGKLTANTKLTKAAEMKLKDMFDRQYFEHISPDGKGPSYLAQKAGYEYIVIGENLALGNFKNDAALVQAWMDSPGHRENILNYRYSEIGVAVGQGLVQHCKPRLKLIELKQMH
jgi:uncharacterized protein YkwD